MQPPIFLALHHPLPLPLPLPPPPPSHSLQLWGGVLWQSLFCNSCTFSSQLCHHRDYFQKTVLYGSNKTHILKIWMSFKVTKSCFEFPKAIMGQPSPATVNQNLFPIRVVSNHSCQDSHCNIIHITWSSQVLLIVWRTKAWITNCSSESSCIFIKKGKK